MATSSTCSLMNHCMNCSEAKSSLVARDPRQAVDLLGDPLLLLQRELDRGDDVGERRDGRPTAGMTTSASVSRRYCTIIIAWSRSSSACAVEERRHLRHRQRVVVDRAREVLVVGSKLVADLGVELVDEAGSDHGGLLVLTGRRGSGGVGCLDFLPFLSSLTFTSLRFLTLYPAGSVPSFSIRIGQRLQRSFDTQHFDLGRLALPTRGRIAASHKGCLT